MPIYEYRCEDCAGTFERLISFGERGRTQVCPACESRRTRVLVSSFAAVGAGPEAGSPLPLAGSGGGCCGGGSCGCGSRN